MPQNIQGTFVSGSVPNNAQISDVLLVPAGPTGGNRTGLINISGDISASNPVTLQRSINSGITWSNIVGPLTSAQSNVQQTLTPVWQYRFVCDMGQAGKTIHYSLSAEG